MADKFEEPHIDEGFNKEKYLELAKNKKVVAIGEIGLDAKYPNPKQKEIFERANK